MEAELEQPSPRKFVNGMPVYLSRKFGLPKKFGKVVLSDFGSAVRGDEIRTHDAQPDVYRSPEVMLKTTWSYPVDIWNVGVMESFINNYVLLTNIIRFGISSRESTCSLAMILMAAVTRQEPI